MFILFRSSKRKENKLFSKCQQSSEGLHAFERRNRAIISLFSGVVPREI